MARRRRRKGPAPRQHKSRQKKHGGGKFQSERQRRWMWAVNPAAARKWAHNKKTRPTDWKRSSKRSRRKRR